ncbi:MAG: GIY-YIG nuclease family protein [Leptospirillum sp.]|jgi:hypothetical protein
MPKGYVYVLVNSSMPGLVKVGKTTKRPSERALELSGVTGIPTPFIVAFEQLFEDCDEAEDYIHAELERKGFREAQNREFFRAQTSDVVRIVMQTPGHSSSTEDNNDESDSDLFSEDDPNEDLDLPPSHPWDDLLEEAENYYYGHGNTILDIAEAIILYKQAAKLGSLVAYQRLGDIYCHEDDYEDNKLALKFYKEGAKRGNYYCYAEMAHLFKCSNQTENMTKCLRNFFKERRKKINQEVEESYNTFSFTCFLILKYLLDAGQDVLMEFAEDMRAYSYGISANFVRSLGQDGIHDEKLMDAYEWAIKKILYRRYQKKNQKNLTSNRKKNL